MASDDPLSSVQLRRSTRLALKAVKQLVGGELESYDAVVRRLLAERGAEAKP